MEIMYKGQVNSPQTNLVNDITAIQTTIEVVDASVLPTAPNILVIGGDTTTSETVYYASATGNVLTVIRAYEGTAQIWASGVTIGRNFTAYDYNTLVDNVDEVNTTKINTAQIANNLTETVAGKVLDATQGKILKADYTQLDLLKRDKAILINQNDTEFVTTGLNLFNKDIVTAGYRLSLTTGDMEVNADYYVSDYISVLANTTYIRTKGSYSTTFYDTSFTKISFLRPGDGVSMTSPAGSAYARLSIYTTTINNEQLLLGGVLTPYEPYKILIPKYTPPRELFIDYDAYPFQPLATLKNNTTKMIIKKAIKKIEIYGADVSKKYALGIVQRNFSTYGTAIYIAECNADGTFNRYICQTVLTSSYVIPTGTTMFSVNDLGYGVTAKVWIDWNEIANNTQHVTNKFSEGGLDQRAFSSAIVTAQEIISMSLPSSYTTVVGDTLEIFYKGIVQAVDFTNFNIKVVASRGSAYKNRYIYTPTEVNADFNLSISVMDNQNNILVTKIATIKTVAVKTNPSTMKNILCIGDSLTNGGIWVRELDRRLRLAGGSPVGNELTNVNFIGTLKNNDTGYEGYGGWNWSSYNSDIQIPFYWVDVTSGMKIDIISQESIWSDGTNQWQLETLDIPNNKIKFKQYPIGGVYAMPTSGTLTFVSGGGDTSNIIFPTMVEENSNPFWNEISDEIDFTQYCTERSYSGIDYVFVLLGWNNTLFTGAELVAQGKILIDALKTQYPNVKVGILGLQVPSIDGMGANYGASINWNYYEKLQKVFEFNTAYENWTKEAGYIDYMSFIHLSSQFDTDNNMPTGTRQVNIRNAEMETYGTNGVHPSTPGHYQIADAVYRKFMGMS